MSIVTRVEQALPHLRRSIICVSEFLSETRQWHRICGMRLTMPPLLQRPLRGPPQPLVPGRELLIRDFVKIIRSPRHLCHIKLLLVKLCSATLHEKLIEPSVHRARQRRPDQAHAEP